MKKLIFLATALFTFASAAYSQIPNNGFENWTPSGNYENPTFWGSTNQYATGNFYPVTKSTDHFPTSVGMYSVRLENDASQNPNYGGRGYLATGNPPLGPDFAISGHPNSLTGFYKFFPQNGDTLLIQIQLYNAGSSVAYGEFATTQTAANWTSFNIPISNYAAADYASIFMAAYYANGFGAMPHGNSILYVDNLNFDVLLNSISSLESNNINLNIYPNPANNLIHVESNFTGEDKIELELINNLGEVVFRNETSTEHSEINTTRLSDGLYILRTKSGKYSGSSKVIIQH